MSDESFGPSPAGADPSREREGSLTASILAARGERNVVNVEEPYHWLVEKECSSAREIEDVATIFLTNRECPWKC